MRISRKGAVFAFLCPLLCLHARPRQAACQEVTAPLVVGIELEGLRRVDPQTARHHIKTRVGAPLDRAEVSRDVKRLFRTGAFKDIEVYSRAAKGGIVLVFRFVERPFVSGVQIVGNKEVSEEDLRQKITVKVASILDMSRVDESVEAIREHYLSKGYYLAKVSYRLEPRPENTVDVVFVIDEGSEVEVHRIEFVGNDHIPSEELKSIMATREAFLLGFLPGGGLGGGGAAMFGGGIPAGKFLPTVFENDLRRIEFYYATKGFAQAKVGKPTVSLSRDGKYIDISIPIHEGPRYTVRKVTVHWDDACGPLPKLKLEEGKIFNAFHVQGDNETLTRACQDRGYAYATVTNLPAPIPAKPGTENAEMDFEYVVQKGTKQWFGRIDIVGNKDTRDWTIRREMRVYEGDVFNQTKLEESKARIRRLGFFESVDISTKPGETPQEVDVVVKVKERQTGSVNVGAGASSIENFMFTAQLSKQNFLGRGQMLSFMALISSLRTIYQFSFDEPYLFDTDFTLGVDAYNYELLYFDFTKRTRGFVFTFGRRFTDEFGGSVSYKLEDVSVSQGGQEEVRSIPVANLYARGINTSFGGTLYYDSRDDRMFPTRGNLSSFNLEWASRYLGSDFEYLRVIARVRQYYPLILGSVLKLAATYGHVLSPTGRRVPLSERFYVGGIFTVRGFERYSLGPKLNVGGARDPAAYLFPFTIGGNKELLFTAEVEFPIFMPVGLRGVVFLDAGNAFDDGEPPDLMRLRTSAGFGIRWWSPIGPLRFEWGFPLKRKKGEPPVVFEFNIGTF